MCPPAPSVWVWTPEPLLAAPCPKWHNHSLFCLLALSDPPRCGLAEQRGEGAVIHRQVCLPQPQMEAWPLRSSQPSPWGLSAPTPIQGDGQGSPSRSSKKLRAPGAEPGPPPCHVACEDISVLGHLRLSRTGAGPFSENHPLFGRPGPVLPCPGPRFPHLLNERLDSVEHPVHPEVCGSRDSAGLARRGAQWQHGGDQGQSYFGQGGLCGSCRSKPQGQPAH